MAEYTPGPWRAVEHGEPGSGWWSVLSGAWDVSHNRAAEPGVVADSRFSAMTPEENAANAQLIAAAPDLYEALRGMLEFAERWGMDGHDDLCEYNGSDGECDCGADAARAAIAKATAAPAAERETP